MYGIRTLLILALVVTATAAIAASPAGTGERVRIRIDAPKPNGVAENRADEARIEGMALAPGRKASRFDVMLAIDVSYSTGAASGSDVDGNGIVGVNPQLEGLPPGAYPPNLFCTDPGDTVLHAEVAAARALLRSLDPRRVRVGLLSFSGDVDPATGEAARPDQRDAWLAVPLTGDFPRVEHALDAVIARGPHGATDFSAAIRLAITELAGLDGAKSRPRPGARKVVLFLTDGIPTFPVGKANVSDPGDVEAAVEAAKVARQAGIRINTYALGPAALTSPVAATEMARVTFGVYTPVRKPGDVVALLPRVSFANVEDVVLTNLTTGDFSSDVRLRPDGSFVGYVPVRSGRNRVRVTALAADGTRGSTVLQFDFRRSGRSNRAMARELERIRRMNKELLLQRERDRIRRFRDREKKQLELEVAPPPPREPPSGR